MTEILSLKVSYIFKNEENWKLTRNNFFFSLIGFGVSQNCHQCDDNYNININEAKNPFLVNVSATYGVPLQYQSLTQLIIYELWPKRLPEKGFF